jgi:large subunit ribosomal protein L4
MKADLFNQNAKVIDQVEIDDSVFNSVVNTKVISQYVYTYLSNQRQGNANTKDKSEVSGGGKKPWSQKGTGNARAGSIRSPIWRGGGITHGPTNDVNWRKKTTKKFRKAAIRSAFSQIAKSGMIKVVDTFMIDESKPLTKQAIDTLNSFGNPRKVTLITAEKNVNLLNSFSNINNAKVSLINEINAYDVLNGGMLLIEQKALDYINKNWAK